MTDSQNTPPPTPDSSSSGSWSAPAPGSPPPPPAPEFPPASAPSYPPPVDYESRTNVTAIVALVMGFLVPIGGIIAGIIALTQIRRTAERGRGLAIGGIAVGSFLTLVSAVILVAVFVLAGIAASTSSSDDGVGTTIPDASDPFDSGDSGDVPTDETDVFTLAVGDCFNDFGSDEVTSVGLLDCAEAHDYEVYFDLPIADAPEYPGEDTIDTQADAACHDAFQGFVGVAWEESSLDYLYLRPTTESWDQGDRLVSCLVFDPSAQTTGSLAGAAR